METIAMSLDAGNRRVKSTRQIRGKYAHMVFDSVKTNGSLTQYMRAMSARTGKTYNEPDEVLQVGDIVLQVEGFEEHFFGDLARRQDPNADSGFADPNRYWNPTMVEYAIIQAEKLAESGGDLELFITTGLPAAVFRPENVEKVQKNLLGTYKYQFRGGPWRQVIISSVDVLQEGAGASLATEDSSISEYACIDIGSHSTDLYAVRYSGDRMEPYTNWCKGAPNAGVENIVAYVQRRIQAQYQTDAVLTAYNANAMLHKLAYPKAGTWPKVIVGGKAIPEYEISLWAEEGRKEAAHQIIRFLMRTWGANGQGQTGDRFELVELVGGGAYYFRDAITNVIPNIKVPAQPEYRNSIGYCAYAETAVPSTTFSTTF